MASGRSPASVAAACEGSAPGSCAMQGATKNNARAAFNNQPGPWVRIEDSFTIHQGRWAARAEANLLGASLLPECRRRKRDRGRGKLGGRDMLYARSSVAARARSHR